MSPVVMMKTTMLLLAVALSSLVAADHLQQLTLICSDHKKAELTKASELPDLLSAAKSNPDEAVCSPKIREALIGLDQLINKNQDDLCSPAHIERIRAYYNDFVDRNQQQKQDKLPKAVKTFLLSYGFGVSRVCKTSSISSLLTDGRNMLDAADFKQMAAFTSDNSPLGKLLKSPKDVDDIVLPSELAALLLDKNRTNVDDTAGEDVKTSIVLQPKAAQMVKEIQSLCARKFEPIYGQLVLPLVSLSRIGLNYKGDELSSHSEGFKSNKNIQQWYRIVYLCELLRIVEVFEAAEGEDKKTVRVLSSEEAKEMRKSQQAGEIVGDKIDFKVATGHKVGDLVVDQQDKSIRKLVSKFDDHKTELRRLRSKLVAQTLSLAKKILKETNLKLVGTFLKRGPTSSLNDQLERIANDYIRQVSQQENTPGTGHNIKKREASPKTTKEDWKVFLRILAVVVVIVLILTLPVWFLG